MDEEQQRDALIELQRAGSMLLVSMQSPAASGCACVTGQGQGAEARYAVIFNVTGSQRPPGHSPGVTLSPGDVLIWDNRTSCDLHPPTGGRQYQIHVPLEYFERSWPGLRVGVVRTACSAMIAVAHAGVQALWTSRLQFPEEHLRIGLETVIDVVARASRPEWPDSRNKPELFDQVLRYIDSRLDDHELGATAIARDHGCSVRSLQALFAKRGQTMTSQIRQRRLEACREVLCSKDCPDRINHVAMRFGFDDAAHFSKLFKATYGMSPRQYRNNAQKEPA